MTTTSHLGVTLLEQAQAQKEVTVNEALNRIDAVLNNGAIDKDLATPPGSPAAGDTYIVAASPTGAWSGKAGQIAYFDQLWRFIVPQEGAMLWVKDEDKLYCYNGTAWAVFNSGMSAAVYDAANIAQQLVGTSATQTVTNKTFNGVRLSSVNKTAAYTATSADDHILCDSSGGAFTITLPSAASSTGQILVLRKTSTDANAVTVGTAAVLASANESVTLQSNGTVWAIVGRYIPGTVASYTPAWTATTTNPTLGNGTIAGRWYRQGRILTADIDLLMGSTTTFGVGVWLFGLPSGLVVDMAALPAATAGITYMGTVTANDAGTALLVANGVYHTSTVFKMISHNGTAYWAATVPFTWAVGDRISARVSVPIVGWEA